MEEPVERFRSREDLQRFFGECDVRETGAREPDWDAHRAVLERSVVRGNPDS
ncbi:MAG TPA: hypothetical protein VHQ65_01225 [Thermoanaerobaculia bacterium]|nr:hypothetical protein [Thermoanaerobaculia bacterium]